MLGRDDLVITAASLGHPPFRELAEAAAAGGFQGVSLWPGAVYWPARERGMSDAEMRSILDAHGLVVNDVDAVVIWAGSEGGGSAAPANRQKVFSAGEALGARFVNVVFQSDGPIDVAKAGAAFAEAAAQAAEYGLTAYHEFVVGMAIPDLATAWSVVLESGREETGLLVDTWHVFRGPTTYDELRRLPGGRVLGIQINDAPAEPMADPLEETMHHRLPPGGGDIDLDGFLQIMDEIGAPAPRAVEVFNDALLERHGAAGFAKLLGDAARDAVARSRA